VSEDSGGEGGTNRFGPKSIYMDFSHNDHHSSSYVLFFSDIIYSTLVYRRLRGEMREWGMLSPLEGKRERLHSSVRQYVPVQGVCT
jgi:hypothetical protein